MNYGFLIRNDRCIGCHACSTACKSENEVPLGVNRTWVKYVDTGAYPDVSRNFQVTRCNHCANPPCVRICPVTAMYQRDDGIVEFDSDACIGCKACLQACPYDAIYIDPDSGTAAKCHFCAHRTDLGMEPACVVVCPEHAIIAGDLDDPISEISRMLATSNVTVRKPEQGTMPKLFYTNGADATLTPDLAAPAADSFMWADVLPHDAASSRSDNGTPTGASRKHARSGAALRDSAKQGLPTAGPIMIGEGRMADHMVQVAYNAQHKTPWHWPVPAYLVTKGIGAGIFLLVSLAHLLGLFTIDSASFVVLGAIGIAALLATTGLLIFDLEKPSRFIRILTRPQWRSWLVKGAYLLVGFSTVAGVWWLVELASYMGWAAEPSTALRTAFAFLTSPLALGTAVYTAFLFGQAEGRDLWQSSLLPVHLIVQSQVAGSATLLLLGTLSEIPAALTQLARIVFASMLVIDVLVTTLGEFGMSHASSTAAAAADAIVNGRYRIYYRASLIAGHLIPLVLLALGGVLAGLAAVLALIGLYLYEYAYVMAPQDIPNS